MDIVLGVSMAPSTVRLVLVEGENADGATVEQDGFELDAADGAPTVAAADRVIDAILGTRESTADGDYQLTSTGVAWTDPVEAAVLRDALAAGKVEKVMLVSAFLAAAALAQSVGTAAGYARTGLLFVEPDTATLAVVDSVDGSVTELRRESIHSADAPTELAAMVAGLDALSSRPDGLFVVGCGVDIAPIKPQLMTATALPISDPAEEAESALARGAALAAANAPLLTSSTAALAYAQVPDWTTAGVVDPYALDDDWGEAFADPTDSDAFELSAAGDDRGRKPFLVALGVMTVFFVGVVALVVSLGISLRPTVSQRPGLGGNLVVPGNAAPPMPQAPVPAAPAPAPAAPAPVPVAVVPAPEAPAAEAPAPAAPALIPAAPAPVPAAPAPAAPLPAPARIPVPIPAPGAPVVPVVPQNLGPGNFGGHGGFGGH